MEHPCYKCQTSIDEMLPFCPHCGAPQIRVASPDEESNQPAQFDSDSLPQGTPPTAWGGSSAYPPNRIQWDVAWKGAFLSGLIAAVLCAIPLVSLGCCLWLLGSGAFAVFLYQRRMPRAFVTPGMGMRIGAASGAIGYLATTTWIMFRFTRDSQEARSVLMEQMEKSIAANPDPRAQDIMRQFMNTLNTPQGLATFFVLMLVVMAVAFVVCCAVGGALGASTLSRPRDVR